MKTKLNLGCGNDIKQGFVNLNLYEKDNVDIICNIEKFPYPFKDNTFEYIYMRNVLEQVTNQREIFQELHRICKDKGIIDIQVFHFSSVMAYYIFTKTFFNYGSFDALKQYGFEVKEKNIILSDKKRWWINILENWINKHPLFYEKTIMKNIFPAYQMNVKLCVAK